MTQAIITVREGAYVVTAKGADLYSSLLAQTKAVAGAAADIAADPGFQAVAADLAGDNNIGTVATNIADVTECADNMAAILAAPQAATDAATAAASVYVTSYGHAFSTGDRTTTGVANGGSFTGVTPASGTLNNLIDGATANNTTDSVNLNGVAFTGVVIWQWIFPKGVWLLCDEWRVKNSGTQSYGTGKLQALKPDGTWVDVSADANNGGATTVPRTATAVDKGGYGGLRLLGTGGTGGSGWMQEVEFKLCPGTLNGTVPLPTTTDQGKVVTQNSSAAGDWVAAKPIDYFETRIAGKGLLRSFLFDQNDDEGTLYDRSGNGATIDLTSMVSTYGGKISRVREGRLLEKAMFQTASLTNIRTAVMVLVPDYETGTSTYMVTTANNGGQINLSYATGGRFASTATVYAGHGGTEVQPVQHNSGQYARKLGRGGPMLVFYEAAAQFTQKFAVGGLVDTVSDTGRVQRMKIAALDLYTGQLDSTDRTFIRRGMRRTMALRGIYFDYRDCPVRIICRTLNGQSNANGDAFVSELAANDQLRTWTPYCDLMTGIADSNGTPLWSFGAPSQARLGFNNRLVLTDRMGPEIGLMFAHEEAIDSRPNRLGINKFAVSSTSLDQHWKSTATVAAGLFWLALSHWWKMEQHYLARGIGPKLIGMDWNQWQNDALSSTFAGNYEANIGTNWTKWKEQTGYSSGGVTMCIAEPADPSSNYAYFSTVNTAITNFDTANADVTKISASGLSYRDTPQVHYTADSYVLWGRRCDAANPSV